MLSRMLSSSRPQSVTVASPVLLSVHNMHEEITAGLGHARCSVRTLDGLSCEIRAGELVILQGDIASGASSLLDVFAGLRTRSRGIRHVAEKVRVRRGAISRGAARAIIAGWSVQHTQTDIQHLRKETPVAYLLRVRTRTRANTSVTSSHHAWRTWAAALRQENCAIVLGVRPPLALVTQRTTQRTTQRAEPVMVREPSRNQSRPNVRVLTLVAGKIVTARSDASTLRATDQYFTASPLP